MGPAWEPCGPEMGTGSARPRRAALSGRAVSSKLAVGRLESSKYSVQWRQSSTCTRFDLGLPICLRAASEVPRDWPRTGFCSAESYCVQRYGRQRYDGCQDRPPWEPRGFGVLQEIILRALSMRVDSGPDLPDAAGVRARLLHSCVVGVPSRRDFTFSTAKFGLSTSWNVFIAAGPPVSSPSSPNVDPRVRIPIPAFPLRRGSLPSLLDHDTQATWAPRPISIRFSTSDSRLSTSVIPFLENQHPFSTEFDTIDPIDSPTTGVFAFSTQKKPPNL